jgi:hypothetical protein
MNTELEQVVARIAELRKLIRRTEWRSEAYRAKLEIIDLQARRKVLRAA